MKNMFYRRNFHFSDMQQSLQNEQKSLDDVPTSDVFEKIDVDFKFEYKNSETHHEQLEKIKELTSRYALKKLLDITYDIEE